MTTSQRGHNSMTETLSADWSGLFFERDDVGYLEVADSDTRHHRVPAGWTLVDIDVCPAHSSQIFRYVRTEPAQPASAPLELGSNLLVAVFACGAAMIGMPLIRALMAHKGIAL